MAANQESKGPKTESPEGTPVLHLSIGSASRSLIQLETSPHGCGQPIEMYSQQGRCQDGFMRGISCFTNHPKYFIYIKILVDKTGATAYDLPRLASVFDTEQGRRFICGHTELRLEQNALAVRLRPSERVAEQVVSW